MTDVYTELLQENSELGTKVLRLEQENKELKEMLSKEPKAMQAFQIAYCGLKRDNEVLWEMVEDYKTALEEIREIEILAYYPKGVPEEPSSQRDFILDAINDYEQRRIKILDKINEVLQ